MLPFNWGGYWLQEKEKEGWQLFAPVEYWESTEEEILKVTGGCGPGKMGDKFVPDTILGETIFLSCQIHDYMYWMKINKKVADRIFILNMIEQVDDAPFDDEDDDLLDLVRFRTVMTYFQAVNGGGDKAFRGTN